MKITDYSEKDRNAINGLVYIPQAPTRENKSCIECNLFIYQTLNEFCHKCGKPLTLETGDV